MDFCWNASVSGGVPPEYEPEQLFSPPGSLGDLFSSTCPEGDMNMEWLSIYVEDCLSSYGNCLPPPAASGVLPPRNVEKRTSSPRAPAAGNSKPLQLMKSQRNTLQKFVIPPPAASGVLPPRNVEKRTSSPRAPAAGNSKPLQLMKSQRNTLQKFVIPGKARSKRNRGDPIGSKSRRSPNQFTSWTHHFQLTSSDPPLLQQAYWLADSELILPKNKEKINSSSSRELIRMKYEKNEEEDEEGNNVNVEEEEERLGSLEGSNRQPRRCTHCLSQRTPQWRGGPLGPKTLCNACGVRYKSGRLLPEYRPAKSPTFVSYKHSNSHKKVLEMRNMSLLSSPVLNVLKIDRQT